MYLSYFFYRVPGFLSLTSLDFVNIRNLGMMKAIGRLCPKLKEVSFLELLHSDSITLDELGAVITFDWPKVVIDISFLFKILSINLFTCR